MKIFLIPLISCSISLLAQASDQSKLSIDELRAYSAIIGGVAMEKKCQFIHKERRIDFELSVKTIQKMLLNRGVKKDYLSKLNIDSSKIAETVPYNNCGEETKMAIGVAFKTSWHWALSIAKAHAKKP